MPAKESGKLHAPRDGSGIMKLAGKIPNPIVPYFSLRAMAGRQSILWVKSIECLQIQRILSA
mgnify:CR=1 FL=1